MRKKLGSPNFGTVYVFHVWPAGTFFVHSERDEINNGLARAYFLPHLKSVVINNTIFGCG